MDVNVESRLAALVARVHQLEDQVQLYQIMSAYGPLVDSGDAEATAALWTEDGIYDWGGGSSARSRRARRRRRARPTTPPRSPTWCVAPYHQAIIKGGAAHVIGLPHDHVRRRQ